MTMDTRRQHELLEHLSLWMIGEGIETKDDAMRAAGAAHPAAWDAAQRAIAVKQLRRGALREEAPQAEIDELIAGLET